MEIIEDYEYNKKDLIGHGAFAAVFVGRNRKKPLTKVAIKVITKKVHISKSQECWAKEIKILKELSCLNHENIVVFMDCKESPNHIYIFMEFCNGGDLSDYLTAKGKLNQDTIYLFLKQIVAAMKLLYAKGIIHRDLKPQNFLLCYPPGMKDPPAFVIVVKIADFGLARFLQDGVMAATLCGSPIYMAPEVIMNLQYDAKADLWSIGTVVFQCLTGKPPFMSQTSSNLKSFYEKNAEVRPNIPDDTSPALKDLLYRLLKRNAKDRIEFEDFFNHPFLQQLPSSSAAPSSPVPYRCPSFYADSSTTQTAISASPLPSQKAASPSPRFGKLECSPTPQKCSLKEGKLDQTLVNTDYPVDELLDASKESGSSTLTEDFVMVPEKIVMDGSDCFEEDKMMDEDGCSDTPPPSLNIVTANPVAMKVMFKKDPSSSPEASPSSSLKASRPSSLPVTSPTPSAMTTVPIPVPNQRSRYNKMMGLKSPLAVDKLQNAMGAKTEQKLDINKKKKISVRRGSETKLVVPDVGTLLPPVQFSIGAPKGQGGQWRRSSVSPSPRSTSPLGMNTSPLKRSNTIPVQISALAPLPAIQGSPAKVPGCYQYPTSNMGAIEAQLWSHREFNGNVAIAAHFMGLHASNTEPEMSNITEDGRSLYSHMLFREAFVPHLHGQVNEGTIIPFAQSYGVKRERVNSFDSDKSESAELGECSPGYFRRNSDRSGSAERGARSPGYLRRNSDRSGSAERGARSPGYLRRNSDRSGSAERGARSPGYLRRNSDRSGSAERGACSPGYFRRNSETSPSLSLVYTPSPPNMEGPIKFTAPELTEETIMDDTHNMTMAKLNFVLDLVECILELAHIKGSKMKTFTDSVVCRQGETLSAELTKLTDTQRCVEQLILYVRSLHLLSSSLQLARGEIKQGRLMATSLLKSVVRQMNEFYHRSLLISRQLQQRLGIAVQNALNPKLLVATADKLMYNYAIEMCQGAALDELYGDPRECFKRYQMAQILLHSVSQQAINTKDKELLRKYQAAVERRLASLQMHAKTYFQPLQMHAQTYTYPYMKCS
ncbi:hypothetical protein ACJMK2_011418 [Sinanodonta woodiana]|uniref:Protein kinase domain-containing protein n=1 Tax=Sinanodonta woodiana TaxID=1069815 RepID=A0ABD3V806_SINWO